MVQIDRCFGFDTAVEEAQRALLAAKVEASSAYKGVGLVKLMGRQSGFIAMQASMASGVVDICLIPEVCSGPDEATALEGLAARAVRGSFKFQGLGLSPGVQPHCMPACQQLAIMQNAGGDCVRCACKRGTATVGVRSLCKCCWWCIQHW